MREKLLRKSSLKYLFLSKILEILLVFIKVPINGFIPSSKAKYTHNSNTRDKNEHTYECISKIYLKNSKSFSGKARFLYKSRFETSHSFYSIERDVKILPRLKGIPVILWLWDIPENLLKLSLYIVISILSLCILIWFEDIHCITWFLNNWNHTYFYTNIIPHLAFLPTLILCLLDSSV